MIDSQIEIAVDDDHRWFVQSKLPDGTVARKTYGNRKSLLDAMPYILAEVRGIAFPSIDMKVDEEITIGTPNRRRTD